MTEICFVVEGNPIPKGRAITRFRDDQPVRTFTPHSTEDWEDQVTWAARQAMGGMDPLTGPLALEVWAYRGSRRRADFDNLTKAITDAIQENADRPGGVVFVDDDQIVDAYIHKRIDRTRPRVEVRVWTVDIDHQRKGD